MIMNPDYYGERATVVKTTDLNMFGQPLIDVKKIKCHCHEVKEADINDPALSESDREWLEAFTCDCTLCFYPYELRSV